MATLCLHTMETLFFGGADLGLHCLPVSRLKWVGDNFGIIFPVLCNKYVVSSHQKHLIYNNKKSKKKQKKKTTKSCCRYMYP